MSSDDFDIYVNEVNGREHATHHVNEMCESTGLRYSNENRKNH